MTRFPVLSRRAVSSVAIALGLMLTVVGTAPSEASNRGTGVVKWFGPNTGQSTTTTGLVAGQSTEPARSAGGPAGLTIEWQGIEH